MSTPCWRALWRGTKTGFASRPHGEVDPLAYQYYSKGRYLWEISEEENLEKSRDYFEQAIEKDPGDALAWAGLEDAYSWLASWGVVPRQEAAPRARRPPRRH